MILTQIFPQVETTGMGRKESITIDIEAGESSDLVEEVLNMTRKLFSWSLLTPNSPYLDIHYLGAEKGVCRTGGDHRGRVVERLQGGGLWGEDHGGGAGDGQRD